MSADESRAAEPVLFGAAAITQRAAAGEGRDTLALMVDAARAAADDALDGGDGGRGGGGGRGSGGGVSSPEALLASIDWVGVPEGMWATPDPGRLVADRIGAPGARTCWAGVGVLQQDLIARACTLVASGELEVALVVGGEARHRAQAARRAGVEAPESMQDADAVPDDVWRPADLGVADIEIIRNSVPPVTSFALVESALRVAQGHTLDEHRAHLGRLWAGFAAVAADLPWAWDRTAPDAATIATPSPDNRLLADPYTRLLASQWNVDQAAALLICSTAVADRLGVAPERRVHAHASAVSNHAVPVPARADLARSPGGSVAAARVLERTGCTVEDLAHLDLYSCFPAAVQVYARELGLPLDRPERLTVTGGMTFAGGPLNNYVLGALARLVQRLREDPGGVGLSSSVSGSLVKQGFGTWSTSPPAQGFRHVDVSSQVAPLDPPRPIVDGVAAGTVVAITVTPDAVTREPIRTVAVVEAPDGARTIGERIDPDLAEQVRTRESVGLPATVDPDGTLHL